MRVPTLMVTVVVLLLAADEPENDLARYQGVWVLAFEEFGGKMLPPERLPELTCTVRDDKIFYTSNGKNRSAFIMLGPSKSPKTYDLLREDGQLFLKGIYTWEDGGIKVCAEDDQGDRPKDFKTEAGSKKRVRVWKRLP